ncbi:MAG: hypothetical protein D6704_00440 [Nitrospirae bacterium]|nr:MAG: hypothetical protein D6704_00440 [Nitrospirota bacterium]
MKERSVSPTRVAIIGGGRGGKALLEIFAQDPLAKIVALAEIRTRAPGITLARRLGVPVIRDYRELLQMQGIDLIIDVTGNPEVQVALQKMRRPELAVIGGASAKFMWQLIEARIRVTSEIEKTLTQYQSLFRRYVKEEAESAVDEVRTRIACEIHDGLVQTLVGVNFKMERCGQLIAHDPAKCQQLLLEAKAQLKHGIQEARQVVFNLRPGQYEKLDLFSALSNYLQSYQQQHRVHVEFLTAGDETRLDPKTKVFLFRIIQEALTNAQQHAKATHVTVRVIIDDKQLMAEITDNGLGFDVQAVSKNPEKWDHFGLRGMKERARLLGGEAQVVSARGKGTTVTICVPFQKQGRLAHG